MKITAIVTMVTAMSAPSMAAETYRLIHAIENKENILAEGLTKSECRSLKKDHIAVAEAMGLHSDRLGIGSITCLPESVFDD